MPTNMDTSQLGYPDCPSQDPLDTVNDLKPNHSDFPKPTYFSFMQEQHDDMKDAGDILQFCEDNNIDLRHLESDFLGFGSNTSKDASPGFDCEDMASAEDDTEHSSSHGKGVRLPANNSGRNNCLVGLASYPDRSDATSCISKDISETGLDPNPSELRGPCDYVAREGGCNPFDLSDKDKRLRETSKLQSCNPEPEFLTREVHFVSADISLQHFMMAGPPSLKDREGFLPGARRDNVFRPVLPPANDMFRDVRMLPSNVEQLFLGTEGPPQLSQSFENSDSMEFLYQGQKSFPVGDNGCPGQPDEPGGVPRLRDDNRHSSQLQTTVSKCHEKSYQTQGPQEPPGKIARIEDNTERMMPTAGFSVGGAAHNSGPQSRILLETSAPLGVESPQQSFLQTTFKAPTLHPEQPAVPPDQTCRVETRNRPGQMILARLAVKGQGSPSTDSDPVPEQQLSPEEQKKAKRRERNRETARKAREKLKNTETQLREEVKIQKAELDITNDEIILLSKQIIDLQNLLHSHNCQAGKREVPAAQAAWQNQ